MRRYGNFREAAGGVEAAAGHEKFSVGAINMTTRSEVSGNGILREVGRCQRENVNRELDMVETRCYRKVR
jgi:hypothetical protein